ncbi:hypothetical protein Tco_0271465 [Tanacetum coccineum]
MLPTDCEEHDLTHQGEKSFAQGRTNIKSPGKLDIRACKDQVRADVIRTRQIKISWMKVLPSLFPPPFPPPIRYQTARTCQERAGVLPGGGSTSRRRGPQAFPDVISREEMDRILRQRDQEAELLRKQTAEAQQRAYLAALKADAAYQIVRRFWIP